MINPAQKPSHLNRREALQTVALATAAAAGGLSASAAPAAQTINASAPNTNGFWPNGARLAISLSLMFEGGGQPISGAGGVIPGPNPVGWNAYWMRNSIHILETLQELAFLYHIDEPSHDEPFIIPVRGRDFVTVPYTFHLNDIVSFPFVGWNAAAYEQALRDEFDQLYEEGAQRRRMMVVSLHDRISGHAGRVRALDRFLSYAKGKDDVWFARKEEIARYVLANHTSTPNVDRGSPRRTGPPGPIG